MLRALVLASVLALAGCQAGYYVHLLRGQYDLIKRREPIEQVLARPGTEAQLRKDLERALDARRFASRELGLPDNGSYRSYADLERPYALWNVFAAPEFSLRPYEWCYPFAGCYAYRGYYDVERARREATRLHEQGFDVHVGGVPAYSTVGWFDDPMLNTLLGPDDVMAGTIFHELAHQQAFVAGDTAFNESFATFVEHEGLRQYLRDAPELAAQAKRRQKRYGEFVELMMASRRRLEVLYDSGASVDELRRGKAAEFERLRDEYAGLKQRWGGSTAYDGWFRGEINNARLLPFGLYHEWVDAFDALFRSVGGDWPRFYAEVGRLAALAPDRRRQQLAQLKAEALARSADAGAP